MLQSVGDRQEQESEKTANREARGGVDGGESGSRSHSWTVGPHRPADHTRTLHVTLVRGPVTVSSVRDVSR